MTKVNCQIIHQCLYCCVYSGVGTCVLGVILIWNELLFLFNSIYYG